MASKYGNSVFLSKEDRQQAYEDLYAELKQMSDINFVEERKLRHLSEILISSIHLYLANNNFNDKEYMSLMEDRVKEELSKFKIRKIKLEVITSIAHKSIKIFYNYLVNNKKYDGNFETAAGKNIVTFIAK